MQTAQIIVPEKFRAGRETVRQRMLHSRAEQDAFFTLFRRSWAHRLTPMQGRIVEYLMDATFGNRRDVVDLTWSQIEAGEPGSDGHEWMRPPIGMSRTQFYDHIAKLETLGAVRREAKDRFTLWSVNLDWKPAATSKTLGDVRREMAERNQSEQSGNPDTPSPETRTPLNRYKIQPVEGEKSPYPTSSRSEGGSAHSNNNTSSPQSEAKGRALDFSGSAPADRQFQQRRNPHWKSAGLGELQRTWRQAWAETYPDVPCPAFSKTEGNMLAAVLKSRFPQDVPARHEFVDFVVRHWSVIMVGEFGWMKRNPPPEMPSVGFACAEKFAANFRSAFAQRKRMAAIDLLPAEARELESMVASGMNREEAIAAIGERRGISRAHHELHEARRISGENMRKEEQRRRRETEERRARDREAFLRSKQTENAAPAETHRFEELEALEPIEIELAPLDLSKWN